MEIDEDARHRLHTRLDEVLGADEAATLMTSVPPYPWPELATKADLRGMEERLRNELVAEIHRAVYEGVNRMILVVVVAMVGAVFTAASLGFAAARMG